MDLSAIISNVASVAGYLKGQSDATKEEQERQAKLKKLMWITAGTSAAGTIAGVLLAKSKGKSKLVGGIVGLMVAGTLTLVIGTLVIDKKSE